MKLSTPKNVTFWITIFLAVIGAFLFLLNSLNLAVLGFVLVLVAYVLLAFANLTKGL